MVGNDIKEILAIMGNWFSFVRNFDAHHGFVDAGIAAARLLSFAGQVRLSDVRVNFDGRLRPARIGKSARCIGAEVCGARVAAQVIP